MTELVYRPCYIFFRAATKRTSLTIAIDLEQISDRLETIFQTEPMSLPKTKTRPPLRLSDIILGLMFLAIVALFAWIMIRPLLNAA